MAATMAAVSPLTPYSKLEEDDNWNTPAPSTQASPVPTKCCELPDYDPSTRRNHSRSKDSQWNSASYPKQATPLVPPPRPKPIRLATPNTGYPFPYVLSRPTTPLEPPQTLEQQQGSTGSSSRSSNSSSTSSQQPSSSSFSDSSAASTPSSHCSTPPDNPPDYRSQATTPHEVQHRRTKNAASTPGAPPPMGFAGKGHANSYVDYEDVKVGSGTAN